MSAMKARAMYDAEIESAYPRGYFDEPEEPDERTEEERGRDAQVYDSAWKAACAALREETEAPLRALTLVVDQVMAEGGAECEDALYLAAYQRADPALVKGCSPYYRTQLRAICHRRWITHTQPRGCPPWEEKV